MGFFDSGVSPNWQLKPQKSEPSGSFLPRSLLMYLLISPLAASTFRAGLILGWVRVNVFFMVLDESCDRGGWAASVSCFNWSEGRGGKSLARPRGGRNELLGMVVGGEGG